MVGDLGFPRRSDNVKPRRYRVVIVTAKGPPGCKLEALAPQPEPKNAPKIEAYQRSYEAPCVSPVRQRTRRFVAPLDWVPGTREEGTKAA
jgi:hypothetical protein